MWTKIAAPLTELTDEQSELVEMGCQTLLLKLEPTLIKGKCFFLPFSMRGTEKNRGVLFKQLCSAASQSYRQTDRQTVSLSVSQGNSGFLPKSFL